MISYYVSLATGLILFGIGIIGVARIPANPIEQITILLEPMGFGDAVDNAYWLGLAAIGVWLSIWVHVRIPAILALVMIIFKIAHFEGVIPEALTGVLSVLLIIVLLQRKQNQHSDGG